MTNKRRLGRGLAGMLPEAAPAPERAARGISEAAIEDVHPNRDQPRSRFDDAALDELAASIREIGILEPILVRARAQGGYEIVAGERRWRAAQRAGVHRVPVFVRELGTAEAFEAALVENLQREDLNPVETARAFARLVDDHGYTQESLAQRVGKDRSTIANALRLLKLPEPVLALLEEGRLSEGHGRALLAAPSTAAMRRLALDAVKGGWSVRETERRVRAEGRAGEPPGEPVKSANVRDLEQRLSRALGTPVKVEDKKGKGRLLVAYASYDELDRLLAQLL
ncbi:MAG: ParB/RepB/Spo0J family partition protein [Sandaracinaceae bacterium]|nr:ParB/RepB/Spo0J family partition protein [Sandaracinaceae bacterium]